MVSIFVGNFELKIGVQKTLLEGWMGGWVEAKAGLRIAYSNQKLYIKWSRLIQFFSVRFKSRRNVQNRNYIVFGIQGTSLVFGRSDFGHPL